jgi:hypothetical protein
MPKSPHIQFTVTAEFKIEAEEYAKAKGLVNASSLARVALVVYMRKNPLRAKTHGSATAARAEGQPE